MKSLIFLLLCSLNLTDGKSKFRVCNAGNLKVAESFKASRLGASMFPCIVSDVFLKYKPPPKVVLVAYRPLCFAIRTCFAMTPTNRITTRGEFKMMSTCFVELWLSLTSMGMFKYYGVQPEALAEFANEDFMKTFLSRVFDCYAATEPETFRIGADSGVAILRWMMERLF